MKITVTNDVGSSYSNASCSRNNGAAYLYKHILYVIPHTLLSVVNFQLEYFGKSTVILMTLNVKHVSLFI
jgi:hypothetical protein